MSRSPTPPDILTLAEAARYLRVPKQALEQQAKQGAIPARRIGEDWRFLKAALNVWLGRPSGKAVLLRQAGAFAGDETLTQIRKEIYERRGRPEVDE